MSSKLSFKNDKKTYELLFSLEKDNNKEYIVYADEKENKSGCKKAYAGIYNGKEIYPIDCEEDMYLLENILKNLDR